jgi:hypothetical protein
MQATMADHPSELPLPGTDAPKAAAPPPAAPARPATGSLANLRAGLTGKLQEATAKLAEAKGLAPQAAPPPPTEEAAAPAAPVVDEVARRQAEAAEASRKRMAFIVAYVKDPTSNPIFQDRALMYKVLAEERTHQQGLLQAAEDALGRMPPPPASLGMTDEEIQADPRLVAQEARRAELEKKRRQAGAVQTQIFNLLKAITGIDGTTGGEDYVPPPEIPQTTEETSTEDAFAAAGELLARLKKKP